MASTISDATLRELCSLFPESWQPSEIVPLGPGRGFSQSQVWRVQALAGKAALRVWPTWMTAGRLQSIHKVLSIGRAHGRNELPRFIPNSAGTTFTSCANRFWELASWIEGASGLEVSLTKNVQFSLIKALAHWHQTFTPTCFTDSLDEVASREEFETFRRNEVGPSRGWLRRRQEWSRLRARPLRPPRNLPDDADLTSRSRLLRERFSHGMDQLFASEPPPVPYVVCHGDFHLGNVLVAGDQVSGIVDFEAVCLDSAARDIARLFGSLSLHSRFDWQESIACYDDIRHLPARERAMVVQLDRSGMLLAVLRWAEWLEEGGRGFDQNAGYHRWRSLVERLEQKSNEALLSGE